MLKINLDSDLLTNYIFLLTIKIILIKNDF